MGSWETQLGACKGHLFLSWGSSSHTCTEEIKVADRFQTYPKRKPLGRITSDHASSGTHSPRHLLCFSLAGREPQLRESLLEEFREVALGVGIPADSIFTMADRGKWRLQSTSPFCPLLILQGPREYLPIP